MIQTIKKYLLSIPGWKTNRKIVVIESDDWGSIRMPSQQVSNELEAYGIDISSSDSHRYNRYDTLASAEDFELLFSVLSKFQDVHGKHPVFTALSLVANPDFEKIRENDFQTYHYELLTDTLKRYYPNQRVFDCWQEGISKKFFIPQFHGREHLNVTAWINALRNKDREARLAFDARMWGYNNRHPHGVSFQAAFDIESSTDIEVHKDIIKDGLLLFENVFGYKASLFVPPNGYLHEDLYGFSKEYGIDFMYSSKWHPIPVKPGKYEKRFNYLGKENYAGQVFITRNAFFEPSQGDAACVLNCIRDIEMAFRFGKPAIISSHRVNYIGALEQENRKRGLTMLTELLTIICKRWPEVEFLTTEQLGRIIQNR